MTLTELRYIVALAREQHFGRAALSCCGPAYPVPVAVKKLEEETGRDPVRTFFAGVRAAPIGEQVVAQAESAG